MGFGAAFSLHASKFFLAREELQLNSTAEMILYSLCYYCYQSKQVIVKINQFCGLIPKQEVDNPKFSMTRNHSCLIIMLSNLIKSTD